MQSMQRTARVCVNALPKPAAGTDPMQKQGHGLQGLKAYSSIVDGEGRRRKAWLLGPRAPRKVWRSRAASCYMRGKMQVAKSRRKQRRWTHRTHTGFFDSDSVQRIVKSCPDTLNSGPPTDRWEFWLFRLSGLVAIASKRHC